MRARLVVFPVRGRNWCFSRSIDDSASASGFSQGPSTFKELWSKVSSSDKPLHTNAEVLVDFVANKMNKAWIALEKAPDGSLKNKVYGLGLKLLSRVKPSEMFLKSISKEVRDVEVIYPSSLNARLVRRRLRHLAQSGIIIHKKYLYGSISLLPLTTAFTVLPLPNVPFFWVLFRTYSHWRALQGSQKLFQLVSDNAKNPRSTTVNVNHASSELGTHDADGSILSWQPSEELEKLLQHEEGHEGLSERALLVICQMYHLNNIDVIKYKEIQCSQKV